jgi:hypothetical protein
MGLEGLIKLMDYFIFLNSILSKIEFMFRLYEAKLLVISDVDTETLKSEWSDWLRK